MIKVYKIQRPDGKFATAGYSEGYTKQGKVWVGRAAIKLHINFSSKHRGYEGCEIIEYGLVELRRIPMEEWKNHGPVA